jgi:hypothetical protein
MIWLVVGIVIVVVVLILAGSDAPSGAGSYRGAVDMYGARKRQEVAQVKTDMRRDGAKARRELHDELDELNKRGRQL